MNPLLKLALGIPVAAVGVVTVSPAASAQSIPSDYTSATRYDAIGRVVGTIAPDPDGSGSLEYAATRTTYDAAGRPIKLETGKLSAWKSEVIAPSAWGSSFTIFSSIESTYDVMDRKSKQITKGSDGTIVGVTQYSYDTRGRLQCTAVRMNPAIYGSLPASACTLGLEGSQGPDRITKNFYDAGSRVLKVQNAVGTPIQQDYVTYTYTENGQQASVVDANGNLASMTYDGHDRQIRWNFPHKTNTGVISTTDYEAYTYDANGNRKTLRKRDGRTITYNYDALNRVVSKTDPDTLTPHVYYGYDNRDLQTYARFGSAAGNGIDIVYDGFGRIKETTNKMFATPRTLSYEYDKNGNRTKITHPGASGQANGAYFTYDYDKLDRVTQIKENGSVVLTTNVYNDRGLPDAMTRTGATTDYNYDAVSRPSGSVHNLGGTYGDVTYGFGYNTASQIVSKSISNKAYITNSHYNIDRQYTTNGLNQYTAAGPASFTYDANGNLTADGTTTYAYDIENRLVTARGEKEANLIYDPMGRLFETNANSSLAQTTTQFLYDGDALVAEYSDAGTLLHRYVHAGGVDSPVVWYIGATVGSGSRSHLHANWQGSITAVTDANADVQWINGYDAYGIPNWFNEGRFQYTGQIMIPELEMYHYKARVYSPTMGRFLQTDPIGYEDQVNLYAYVGNDPVGRIDPSGLDTVRVNQTGSHIPAEVEVDADLTGSQSRVLGQQFKDFILANDGKDIGSFGKPVQGGDAATGELVSATTQFVGASFAGEGGEAYAAWQEIVDVSLVYAPGAIPAWIGKPGSGFENNISLNLAYRGGVLGWSPSNTARSLFHETAHKYMRNWSSYGREFFTGDHRKIDDNAKRLLKKYGLDGGGCEASFNFSGC